jgi:hypothetical protein
VLRPFLEKMWYIYDGTLGACNSKYLRKEVTRMSCGPAFIEINLLVSKYNATVSNSRGLLLTNR